MSTTEAARESFDSFHSGNHGRCGQLLEQINSCKGTHDVKVQHNVLINEYYLSGCLDPQNLLTQLTQVYDRARERDKKDKGRKKREDEDDDSFREDEDLSVLRYNQALLCLQLRQHAQAALILEELFENIEPIDDFLAIKICFLLLELCLLQREPEQAVAVLAYLEKPNAFLTLLRSERPPAKGAETRASEEGGGETEDTKPASCDADDVGDEGDESPEIFANASADPVVATNVRNAGATGAEATEASKGPLPSLALGAFLPRHGRAPDTISRAEYRFFCLMYRARLSVALKNIKAAKKDAKNALEVLEQELRHAPVLTPHTHTTGTVGSKTDSGQLREEALREGLDCQHHAMVNMFKAYLEYTRQNARKAMKLLTLCQFNFAESRSRDGKVLRPRHRNSEDEGEGAAISDFHPAQDEACASVFFNNLGCIHFMMHKPSLAAFYFQKALQQKAPPAPAGTGANGNILGASAGLTLPGVCATRHWLDRRAETAYNAGLQMLMSERPLLAFKCFEQCTPVLRTWPRLWIRLAECCIQLHQQAAASGPDGIGEIQDTSLRPSSAAVSSSARAAVSDGTVLQRFAWRIQGDHRHRRWFFNVAKTPPVGRRTIPGDDDDGTSKREGADGETYTVRDGQLTAEGALVHATMCLRNVLVLAAPLLPERSADIATGPDGGSEGSTATPGAVGSANAASIAFMAAQDKAATSAGAGTASARTGKAPTGPGAVAAAGSSAGGRAGGTSPGGTVPGSGSRMQARDLLECEASLLEDVALVKLAYVSLCRRDTAAALVHGRRLMEKHHMLPPQASSDAKDTQQKMPNGATAGLAEDADEARKHWTFQAQSVGSGSSKYPMSIGSTTLCVLYTTEALLISGKLAEARTLLGSFVSSSALSRGLEFQNGMCSEQDRTNAASADGAHRRFGNDLGADRIASLSGYMGGLTPPTYLAQGTSSSQSSKEGDKSDVDRPNSSKDGGHATLVSYGPSEFPCLGDTQCMLYTNLAALQIQEGHLDEAERACEKALQVQPRALAPLHTLVYILLRRGQHAQALERLKQSRMPDSRVC
mmetsp:Transcript_53258/g.105865  ORF Transcript_53258/g.105865 Transcript_53258/m.105865 type:complete len:1056 (-) Transcript_53258:49-3216(-)|eukprot:CAMPEP_0172808208 /NCGR_PEP_ID=MMETSP1075-20121228/7531_1 /TAXON_ID=2916 /ORGANISM="Ceratium fusus, Strain PA161109" /LENGTH=1055 /DNA_ID=CAMNT_0013647321 /DNA_START=27 /DNA_END=3194 /DNA_ORIENTATION=+